MEVNIEEIKDEIIEKLKPLNPDKIILFGSYAYGTPNKDSDIDLYIVTNDNFIPQSFDENMKVKLKVLRALESITDITATDIIIHTKLMNEKFIKLNSYFSRKIYQDGVVLYEK